MGMGPERFSSIEASGPCCVQKAAVLHNQGEVLIMYKLFLTFALVVGVGISAFAQSSTDYKKGEFYIGYSNGQVDTGVDSGSSIKALLRDRANFNGFEAAGVYNVSRYVGLKADLSGTYNRTSFSVPVGSTPAQTLKFNTDNSLYNVLGGIQVKDNENHGRFKPFLHALVGVGIARTKVRDVSCTTSSVFNCADISDNNDKGLAGAFGGGIDLRLTDHVDFRLVQVDYNPIRFNGQTDNNVRFGIGLVFK